MARFRILFREFLFRMVDLELLSSHAQGDSSRLLGQFASLLLFISVLISIPALGVGGGQGELAAALNLAWSIEHFLIATTMLLVGLFAVLRWDSAFPDRRDVLVLAPLPIRWQTLLVAKVAAVAAALCLTVAVFHAVAGLAWPAALNAPPQTLSVPALTTDAARTPVDAAGMESVLASDLAPARAPFAPLAVGTGTGVAVGVSQRGVRRIFTFGPARPDSIFEIASVTKTFTGIALAQLVLQGKVRLDQPIRELLPPGAVRKPKGAEITLLDLATHHSGLPRMPANLHAADDDNPLADYTADDLYAFIAGYGVAKPPDAEFLYSNLGFGLLGQALANRAGAAWPALIKTGITDPLGMSDTTVALSPEQAPRFIQGHDAGHRPVRGWDLDALAGAGALRSTAGDMLTYLEANLHPERLASRELAAAIAESQAPRAVVEGSTRVGLGWGYRSSVAAFTHSGGTGGFGSHVAFSPEHDYAIVVLVNQSPAVPLADMIGEHIRQRLSGEPAVSLAFVTIPASRGILGWARRMFAYWFTMLAAGAFIFGSLLTAQGLAAQLLPRPIFLRASSFLQVAAFCTIVGTYFLQPMAISDEVILAAQRAGRLSWSPSFWFLGLFQQLNGSPALAPLARRAWAGLAVVGCGTALAYGLCYLRTLRQIVEQPEIAPHTLGARWMPQIGKSITAAIIQFSVRTLLRSRLHRMILAFYLGIGFSLTILFLKTPLAQHLSETPAADPWRQVSVPLLASSILLMGFWVMGVRVAFSLPLDLRANWIFQIAAARGGADYLAARRRSLLLLSVIPVWVGLAALFLYLWPLRAAVGHLAILGLVGLALAEISLNGAQKIPFTCAYLPGKSNIHLTFWILIGLVLALVAKGAAYERLALMGDRAMFAMVAGVLLAVWAGARWRAEWLAKSGEGIPRFEEEDPAEVLTLGL